MGIVCLLAGSGEASAEAGGSVTLAVSNARIWTGDEARPWAEALVVSGERITAVGTNAQIEALADGARAIDVGGRLMLPGFIDTHVHFLDAGFGLSSVKLRDAGTPEELSRRIAEFAAGVPPGSWITGGDWDHELWGGELPHRDWIDAVTPEHPVWVSRLDGHMALANGAALAAAGVTAATPEVEGGVIVRDTAGRPTGILKDEAMALVQRVIPDPPDELEDQALLAAMRHVSRQGVTSVHSMGSWDDLAVFERAAAAGRLTTRIYAAVPLASWERLRDRVAVASKSDLRLRIGALKGFVDGSLGSHTAAFHEPYTDAPEDRGLFLDTPEELYEWILGADAAGLHVMVHAIGDRANAVLLDAFERVARENGMRDRRFRIEHAQHLAPVDIPRFGSLGIIPSMQPYHAIDDGRWAERVIGPERAKGTYAFRSLLDGGARLVFGSDWSVAPPTPLEGIFAAMTRRTLDRAHPGGWVPEQKISLEEALRAYTSHAAFASFEENVKGTLATGFVADFVVLDRDLFTIPPEEIREVEVRMTVVGGQVVFER